MATLYLVRHGTTKYNYHGDPKQDRVKGTMDVPLDERGKMVAHQAADQLAKLGVTHVITPDLARGLETAHIISQKTGAKIAVSSRLRPWDVGMFAGKPYYSVSHFLKHYQQHPDETPPNGESYNTFVDRWRSALPEMLDLAKEIEAQGGKLAAVSTSRHFLSLDAVLNGQHASTVKKVYGAAPPGSIMELKASATKPRQSSE
jgi:uncharacterized phosphatase